MPRHVIIDRDSTRTEILQIGQAGNACPGMLYKSSDTNEMWFGATDGSLIGPVVVGEVVVSEGIYASDFDAGEDGVLVGKWYECAAGHEEGAVEGTLKKRKT